MADFGPAIALKLTDEIRDQIRNGAIQNGDQIFDALKASIASMLSNRIEQNPPLADAEGTYALAGRVCTVMNAGAGDVTDRPLVWMIVGVNGGGKTTTIGKLAHRFVQTELKVST